MFFQQFKLAHAKWSKRAPTNWENFGLGAAAAAATVCITIPLDTAKTRIVTQVS
jgi:Mitochondrial carrier protein